MGPLRERKPITIRQFLVVTLACGLTVPFFVRWYWKSLAPEIYVGEAGTPMEPPQVPLRERFAGLLSDRMQDDSGFDPAPAAPQQDPITKFPILDVGDPTLDDQIQPDELVLGVVIDGNARAYPINMLTGPQREILNDELAGHAIAATW